ncbi:hypothetical protein [Chryseobacterium sp. Marseille-Q8038]
MKKDLSNEKRRELINHFQEVFKDLQIINSDRKELYKKESIEALSKLAVSSDLKEHFKQLVECYLDDFEGNKVLLIAIDDFDINVDGAYKMLEDIRQFIIQQRVILLIACKMEQLTEAIKIQYKNLKIEDDIEDKSKRYIDKLIPFNRRIALPDVQKLENIKFKVLLEKKIIFDSSDINFNQVMIKLIFEKLNLLQVNNQLGGNFILPETIRETQNFINILLTTHNIEKIREYIISEIYKINEKRSAIIRELEDVSDELFLIIVLKKLYYLRYDYYEKTRFKDDKTFAKANIASTVSLGDIYFFLEDFESSISIDNYADFKFLDLFKMYFSLRIMCFKNDLTKLEFTKYGFVNRYLNILSKEKYIFSRDFIDFNKSLNPYLKKFDSDQKFLLSLFVLYLGEGYETYRETLDKDIFVDRYTKGTLSPFAILHNIYNIDILSSIFHYDIDTEFIKRNIEWFNNSIFIKQLYNPSFTLKLFEYINEFRLKEVKDSLPNNYFDDICLLFIYGTIYSLDKIENIYNINGLVTDYIDYPVIKIFLKYFNKLTYSNKTVVDLNELYDINGGEENDENEQNENKSIDSIKQTINKIYEVSKIENDNKKKNEELDINKIITTYSKKDLWNKRTLSNFKKKIVEIDPNSPIIKLIEDFYKKVGLITAFEDQVLLLMDFQSELEKFY